MLPVQGFYTMNSPDLGRWQGKLSIRSGTARFSVVPDWDDDVPLAERLPWFPGSQVQITIPAQEADPR